MDRTWRNRNLEFTLNTIVRYAYSNELASYAEIRSKRHASFGFKLHRVILSVPVTVKKLWVFLFFWSVGLTAAAFQ